MQIPVTIIGVAFDNEKGGAVGKSVTIVGELHLAGLSVGGGPAEPPVGIWPSPGHPAHPIAPGGVPGAPTHPIHLPPGIWGGGNVPGVTPPIVIPPPPLPFPEPPPEGAKPPPPEGGWGYSPEYGWGYFPPADAAKPKHEPPKHVGAPPSSSAPPRKL